MIGGSKQYLFQVKASTDSSFSRREGHRQGAHHKLLLLGKVGLRELWFLLVVQFHEVCGGIG